VKYQMRCKPLPKTGDADKAVYWIVDRESGETVISRKVLVSSLAMRLLGRAGAHRYEVDRLWAESGIAR